MHLEFSNRQPEVKDHVTSLSEKFNNFAAKIYLALFPNEKSIEDVMQDIKSLVWKLDRNRLDKGTYDEISLGMKNTMKRYIRYIDTNIWEWGNTTSNSVEIRHLLSKFDTTIGRLIRLSQDDYKQKKETKKFLNNIYDEIAANKLRIV